MASLLLSACGGTVYRTKLEVYCPPIQDYSPEFNASLADEIDSLPDESHIPMVVGDYAKLRDRIRACEKEKGKL